MKYIVYSNSEESFVMTKEDELKFRELAKTRWAYDLDDGDFERIEVPGNDPCVKIKHKSTLFFQ